VYPSSGNVADPSVVKTDLTGWCVIDWAQLEATGGTFFASSPVIGGDTRNTENFTTNLPDGEIYATFDDNSYYEVGKLVATAVSGDIIWEWDDYVHKNLLFSTTSLASGTVYNMHEFGLVDDASPPQNDLQILTTTLYPVEVTESLVPTLTPSDGYMILIPEDFADAGGVHVSTELDTILLYGTADPDEAEAGGVHVTTTLTSLLIEGTANPDEADAGGLHVSTTLTSYLITADTPDESLDISIVLDASGCSMTAV
jgi:hypothetical protein